MKPRAASRHQLHWGNAKLVGLLKQHAAEQLPLAQLQGVLHLTAQLPLHRAGTKIDPIVELLHLRKQWPQ